MNPIEQYKQYKTIDEQITHLKKYKRLVFNICSEDKAKDILYKYNYINVITPFKYNFCKKEKGIPIKDENGRHIYERNIDFQEYYELYLKERNQYPKIYRNISSIETMLNALVSHEAIVNYHIINSKELNDFFDQLKIKMVSMTLDNKIKVKINDTLNNCQKDIYLEKEKKYQDVYLFFDRLSFNKVITIYNCLEDKYQRKIFDCLKNNHLVLDTTGIEQYMDVLRKIVHIRNCVYHNNSLTILVRYYNPYTKVLRSATDRRKYKNIIKKLAK